MSRTYTQDQVLIDQLMQHNTEAFEELYRRYWYSLYSYSFSKLQSIDQSKMIVKQLFVDLWSQRESLPLDFSVNTYLYTELRKAVVVALNEQLLEEEIVPQLKQFDVHELNKARIPVRVQEETFYEQVYTPVPKKAAPSFNVERYVSFFGFHQWKKALQSMMNF